jgi:hypothetical protein
MVVMWWPSGHIQKPLRKMAIKEQRFFGVYSCCEKIKALRQTQWVIF